MCKLLFTLNRLIDDFQHFEANFPFCTQRYLIPFLHLQLVPILKVQVGSSFGLHILNLENSLVIEADIIQYFFL